MSDNESAAEDAAEAGDGFTGVPGDTPGQDNSEVPLIDVTFNVERVNPSKANNPATVGE